MKLYAVALVLSCVISPVFLVSPINTPKVCMGTGFVPVDCKEDLIASVFAGTDGAQGNQGRIGLLGPRGPKGDRASLCDQKSRTKIRCQTIYDDFLKVQREVRWMDKVLHVLFGYDIDDLTKTELIKLVLTQNIKIVDDTTVIESLDEKVTNLTQKVENAGRDIHGRYIEVIKDNKKKIAEIESLTDQNKKFKDQVAELPAKEKEINDLKTQVNTLKETIKDSGTAVKELTKAQDRLKVIEAELKSTSEGLNAKIKILEEAIKIKTTESAVLVEKLKESTAAATKNAEVAALLTVEKEKLKGVILVNQAACKTNMLAKEAELDVLKKELAALKLNCKDVEKQTLLIAALNKQIEELKKEKPKPTPEPKKVSNQVYFSTDLSKPAATIADEYIGKFTARYVKDGKIVLPSVMGYDGTGPYMILVNRFDGSQDFKKKFAEYQAGFGDISGEFWMGLDVMSALTKTGTYKCRVELTDHADKQWYANYGKFSVGAAPGYQLTVDDFTGDTYNSLRYHNQQLFSAIDKDQDATDQRHCADNSGGWWFKRCQFCLLTGTYHKEVVEDKTGVRWYDRRVHGRYYSWKKAVLMITPV